MKQYTVKEIADSITKMDSTSPVDALAELMRRHLRATRVTKSTITRRWPRTSA
jgi:hypothetical protein